MAMTLRYNCINLVKNIRLDALITRIFWMNPDQISENTKNKVADPSAEAKFLREIHMKEQADQATEDLIAAILMADSENEDTLLKARQAGFISDNLLSGSLVQNSDKSSALPKAQKSLESVKIKKKITKLPFTLLIRAGCLAIPSMQEINYSRLFNVTPEIVNKIRELGVASQVRDIEFSRNSLQKSLPENLFEGFVNLERINLSKNNLHYLPENIFKDLISSIARKFCSSIQRSGVNDIFSFLAKEKLD
jgi:hypothetical protein